MAERFCRVVESYVEQCPGDPGPIPGKNQIFDLSVWLPARDKRAWCNGIMRSVLPERPGFDSRWEPNLLPLCFLTYCLIAILHQEIYSSISEFRNGGKVSLMCILILYDICLLVKLDLRKRCEVMNF